VLVKLKNGIVEDTIVEDW